MRNYQKQLTWQRNRKRELSSTEEGRAKYNRLNREENTRLKLETFTTYSNGSPICTLCNEDDFDVLSLDHINGGGGQERKRLNGSYALFRKLRREGFPTGYRILCMNCNMKEYKIRMRTNGCN